MNGIKNMGFWEQNFNRYMVECEFRRFNHIRRIYIVLIDTWWNVNVKRSVSFF